MKIALASIAIAGAITATFFVGSGHSQHVVGILSGAQVKADPQSAVFFDPRIVTYVEEPLGPCGCATCCVAL